MEYLVDCPYCEKPIKLPADPSRLVGTGQDCPHCGKRGIFSMMEGDIHFVVPIPISEVDPHATDELVQKARFTDKNSNGKRRTDAARNKSKKK